MRLWLTVYMVLACVLQWAIGNVDVRWFAFPVGAAIGCSTVAILYVAEREWGRCRWIGEMRSARISCLLIGLTVVACIVGGFMPVGLSFQTSVPFVALLIALTANLTLAILHRLRSRHIGKDWVFLTTHTGIWLLLFCGLVGAGDNSELRAVVGRTQDTTSAMDCNGRMVSLPYSLRLSDFCIETDSVGGLPVQYSATILIDNRSVCIAVNDPHSQSLSEDIYLMSFHQRADDVSCVLMIERQPWKYPMLAGICLLLSGAVAGGIRRVRWHEIAGTKQMDNRPDMTEV